MFFGEFRLFQRALYDKNRTAAGLVLLVLAALLVPPSPALAAQAYTLEAPAVYYDVVWDLERGSSAAAWVESSAANYAQARGMIRDDSAYITARGGTLDIRPDVTWVQLELDYCASHPGEANLWAELDASPRVDVLPHAHEHEQASDGCYYNTADVAYLLSLCGVQDHRIVGGVTVDDLAYTEFATGQRGAVYVDYVWYPQAISGGANAPRVDPNGDTFYHQGECSDSGLWRPSCVDYYEPGDYGLVAIGGRSALPAVVARVRAGDYDGSLINTAELFVGDVLLMDGGVGMRRLGMEMDALASLGQAVAWSTLADTLALWYERGAVDSRRVW